MKYIIWIFDKKQQCIHKSYTPSRTEIENSLLVEGPKIEIHSTHARTTVGSTYVVKFV